MSVCSLAGGSLGRTALILERFRGVADEIVCVIDSSASLDGIDALLAVTDRCVRAEVSPVNTERLLAWMHSLCSADWILRVDNDEPPSRAFIEQLPEMIRADDIAQYLVRRLWVWPDERHYIDEYPWADDFQIRLVRNNPATLRFRGGVHTAAEHFVPHRYCEAPLYHLACLIDTPEARRAKAQRYEQALPGITTPRGFPLNGYFFPEELASGQLSGLPTEDIAYVRDVWLPPPEKPGAADLEFYSLGETDRHWALRPMPESAYRVQLEPLERVTDMEVGEQRVVATRVQNLGTERWPWGDFFPAFRMAARWHDPAGSIVDNSRTLFAGDVAPGSTSIQKIEIIAPSVPGKYALELNVLHEGVRWCDGGWRGTVTVHASGAAPTPKWQRRNLAAAGEPGLQH